MLIGDFGVLGLAFENVVAKSRLLESHIKGVLCNDF